jgi:hypothetical protein
MLREQKTDYYDIKRWIGHSSIQITIDIYGQALNDQPGSRSEGRCLLAREDRRRLVLPSC